MQKKSTSSKDLLFWRKKMRLLSIQEKIDAKKIWLIEKIRKRKISWRWVHDDDDDPDEQKRKTFCHFWNSKKTYLLPPICRHDVYRSNCSLRISSFFSRHRFQIAIDVQCTTQNWLTISLQCIPFDLTTKHHFKKSIWSNTRYLEIVIRRSQERKKKDLLVITSNSLLGCCCTYIA